MGHSQEATPHLGQDEKMVRMFQHEAEIASRVDHPNVIRVIESGQVGEDHFLTQEHLLSVDLQSMLKHLKKTSSAFPSELLLYVLEQLLLGLGACHRLADATASPLAVVHRDITPENILLGYDGRVMLTDFGIATSTLSYEGTQHGAPKGKTRYLSPEQALKQPLDGRSDLFSLGAVLYEAFQGRPLFDGVNQFVILEKVRAGEGLPGDPINRSDLPEPARVLLESLLAPHRHDRPADAETASALLKGANLVSQQDNMSQFVRRRFAKALSAYEESNERHLRLDLLDEEVVEHAPPRLDITGSFAKTPSIHLGSDASSHQLRPYCRRLRMCHQWDPMQKRRSCLDS